MRATPSPLRFHVAAPESCNVVKVTGHGIFCLEGDWGGLLDRTSVRLGLDMLLTVRGDRLIHRNAVTSAEFEHYLRTWSSAKYDGFPLAYFSYHGSPGQLNLGRNQLSLQDLADLIPRSLPDRVLYFGACATLAVPEEELTRFVARTGVKAIAGYTMDVDWK